MPRRALSDTHRRFSSLFTPRALACAALLTFTQAVGGINLEAPESVAAPYASESAWGISPVLAWEPDPIPNAWGAWADSRTIPAPIARAELDISVAPAFVTVPIQIAGLLETAGLISFAPHADLAWAEMPMPIERPYRRVTFLGEGEKPHGTLDFAGQSPGSETIAAE